MRWSVLAPGQHTAHQILNRDQEIRRFIKLSRPRDAEPPRYWATVGPVGLTLDHFDRRVRLQRKAATSGRDDLHIWAFFLEAMAQKDQTAFEVVFHGRKTQRFVEANFAVRELHAP